jgi:hypothetical protein
MRSQHAPFILSAIAISFGVTVGGMITTAATGKNPELMLGGVISLSACGFAAGYCEARADVAFAREMEARRLAR